MGMTKIEQTLAALKDHEDTGSYMSLYVALRLVINANKMEPQNVSPLLHGLSKTVLEPLFLQVEKHLQELRTEQEQEKAEQDKKLEMCDAPKEKKEELGKVIFVDFIKKKRALAS